MSKPMVVTLPFVMILLDYWPLRRFETRKDNLFVWQLKEKISLFILSMFIIIITCYTPPNTFIRSVYEPYDMSTGGFSLLSRLFNASIALTSYLIKTFWPYNLAIFYPFPSEIPVWHIIESFTIIIFISVSVIFMAKRLPYLFVGWFWYTITIVPVIGLVQIGAHSMADRYTYIPLTGMYVILAWGMPEWFKQDKIRRNILLPSGIILIAIMAFLAWKQCGYWKNGITLFTRALAITQGNYVTHNNLAIALSEEGLIEEAIDHYNQSIKIVPDGVPLNNLGNIYADLGQYQKALDYYNEAIRIRPDYADAYFNRGLVYAALHRYQLAIDNYDKAIRFKPSAQAYNNRGNIKNKLGQYQLAIEDYNNAIKIDKDNPWFYINRSSAYFNLGNKELGCSDAQQACDLGNCNILNIAKTQGLCR